MLINVLLFISGSLGQFVHIMLDSKSTKTTSPASLGDYIRQNAIEVSSTFIFYCVVFASWFSGEIFKIPELIGMQPFPQVEMGFLTNFLIGFSSGWIMDFVLSKLRGKFGSQSKE